MLRTTATRRGFIGGLGAVTVSGVFGAPAGRRGPGELRLGVATYSLRKLNRTQAIKALKVLGVQVVSIKSFHLPYELPVAELKSGSQEFRDAGLEILSGGNIPLTDPKQLRAMFEYARNCGIPMMVCAPSHETLDEVEKLVKEFGIRTAIHNHGPEDKHFPTPESVLEAVEKRDYRMGLCLDIGHTTRTGADAVEWMKLAGPRLFDVHVKDLRDLLDGESQCPVGDGAMPIVSMFKTLLSLNYRGGVMLEYEIDADDPVPGMIRSISYMRGVLDGLAAV